MNKFKVGDIVIGMEMDSKGNRNRYSTTKFGWKGKIIEIDFDNIKVEALNRSEKHWVEARFFKLNKSKKCFKENIYV